MMRLVARGSHISDQIELAIKRQLIANYSLQKNINVAQMVKGKKCRCGRIVEQDRRNYN